MAVLSDQEMVREYSPFTSAIVYQLRLGQDRIEFQKRIRSHLKIGVLFLSFGIQPQG